MQGIESLGKWAELQAGRQVGHFCEYRFEEFRAEQGDAPKLTETVEKMDQVIPTPLT